MLKLINLTKENKTLVCPCFDYLEFLRNLRIIEYSTYRIIQSLDFPKFRLSEDRLLKFRLSEGLYNILNLFKKYVQESIIRRKCFLSFRIIESELE